MVDDMGYFIASDRVSESYDSQVFGLWRNRIDDKGWCIQTGRVCI